MITSMMGRVVVLLKTKGSIQTDDHEWLEIEEHGHIESPPELVYHSL